MATNVIEAVPPINHERVLVVFSGLVLAMLLAALDSTIVSTALPTIVGEMGGLSHISWVVTAYLLAQTVVTPLYGKMGDLYGRKKVLQGGIILFLIGSALCGLSQSMTELIFFRAVQGLGGGGLMVTSQAVIGDLVPPRDRGRYQGIIGSVFGVSSVAGPLLGGYFTTHFTWRWIFYINLPLGLLALVVLAATMPKQTQRKQHRIDLAGAGLLAITLSAIVLVCDLAGTAYPWGSPMITGLAVICILSLGIFLFVERRAAEPVLPLRLFTNQSFWVATAVALIVGFGFFGALTYLPLFLQVVKGLSPTTSGLQLLPMMIGLLVTSISSGQIISRIGRYKIFPVMGMAVMSLGLFLLSFLTPDEGILLISLKLLVLGLGLGMVMQVLVIAVQNAVDYSDLGVATSGVSLFRLVGGSLGTSILGALFAAQLSGHLIRLMPMAGATAGTAGMSFNPEMFALLPSTVRAAYSQAITSSLNTVFLIATIVALVGFVLVWFLPERPLRETLNAAVADNVGNDVGQALAMPLNADSLSQILAGIIALANRDIQRHYIAKIVARAGLDLSPAAAWLLVKIEKDPALDIEALSRTRKLEPELLRTALGDLLHRQLIYQTNVQGKEHHKLTSDGCSVLNRLGNARRNHLAELATELSAEKREELSLILRRIANDLVPEVRNDLAAD